MRLFNKNNEGEVSEEQKAMEIEALKNELNEAKAKKTKVKENTEEVRYMEREISLTLLNEKLNYLIAAVEEIKRMAQA